MAHDVNALVAVADECSAQEIAPIEPEYIDGEDETVRTGWAITTAASADWALSRLGSLEAEIADLDAQEKAALERVKRRAEKLRAQVQRGVAFFEMKLAEYATTNRQVILGGGKKKSRSYLSGTIGWRAKKGRLAVVDKAQLVAWLETQPAESGLYRVKVEPEMEGLQKLAVEGMQIPPGCVWEDPEDVFYAKPVVAESAIVKAEE